MGAGDGLIAGCDATGGTGTAGSDQRDGSTDRAPPSNGGGCGCDFAPAGTAATAMNLIGLALVLARRRKRQRT
jgi:MYXO-CTERM domain-containing protein